MTQADSPKLHDVTVYYLEMLSRPELSLEPPRDGLTVIHAVNPSVPYYRFLYNAVGENYRWLSRRKLSDEELTEIIHDPLDDVLVLHLDGTPIGFAEICRREPANIELVQFGLMPDWHGQGIGSWFLRWVIDKIWQGSPQRFWLHTCTFDHPAALAMYQKAGFVLYDEKQIQREY
ncbi:GNAT family N-acetyltransferase [Thalassoroseus pseudoceratinae]|uniref:GNAT family N-acetyltransferase n=1 Tax=Thalassoroseus pseudoceratinae TaxID=2713176 RepID=UPI00141DF448|nr:GNAT family N-acetyltransferase [Thalassoroseus pseudoceratinae]